MQKISTTNASGEKLAGIKEASEMHSGKCAVLVHGFAYYKEEAGLFTGLAPLLARLGYHTYYFDFSGCGESEGDFVDATPSKLMDDLKKMIEFAQYDSEATETLIVTQSFAGPLTIALNPKADMMVMMGAFAEPYKLLSSLFEDKFDRNGISVMMRSNGSVTRVDKRFWDELERLDVRELVKKIDCPIHYIHGGEDKIVPVEQMEILFENSRNATKSVIPGNDHGMMPDRDALYQRIVHLINKSSSGSSM